VLPDDALGVAATAQIERSAMAQGIYAWRWTRGDRRARRFARADGVARCSGYLYLGSARPNDRDDSAMQCRAVAGDGRRRRNRTAEQRQRNKASGRIGTVIAAAQAQRAGPGDCAMSMQVSGDGQYKATRLHSGYTTASDSHGCVTWG